MAETEIAEVDPVAKAFARMKPEAKSALFRSLIARVHAAAPRIVEAACRARAIEPDSAAAGEEWFAGPVTLLTQLRLAADSLEQIARSGRPELSDDAVSVLRGRVVARALPRSLYDRARFRGVTVDVILDDETKTKREVSERQALVYKGEHDGGVAIVRAESLAEGIATALAKMLELGHIASIETDASATPLAEVYREALAPIVEPGYLKLTAKVGETPANEANPTSPVAIVPYLYALDEIEFQAKSIAAVMTGATFRRSSPPTTLVHADGWPQRELFVERIEKALDAIVPSGAARPSLEVRATASEDPIEFLRAMPAFCNALGGRLGAQVIIHPHAADDIAIHTELEDALLAMRFGVIGVNQPAALARRLPMVPWGAHPSVPNADRTSGVLLFSGVEKAIVRGPLRRAPKPSFFADNRRANRIAERLAEYEASPGLGPLLGAFKHAVRG